MKRILIALLILSATSFAASAQWDNTEVFAERDTCTLSMDIYMPSDTLETHPCFVYVYGGGFAQKHQRAESITKFCRQMADAGYVVAATDYRLGLKETKSSGPLGMIDDMNVAVNLAVEDLFSAVSYILDNAVRMKVDPKTIILAGGSAGAITVLQADYELGNRTELASAMPEDFRFAGVISFSGAIYSHDGACQWKVHSPAPTLFLHGTSDVLVTYKQIRFFDLGLFGTKPLVDRFRKYGYPYMCIRFENRYHEVASFHSLCQNEIQWFIEHYINQHRNWQIDINVTDPDMDIAQPWNFNIGDLYGK